MSPKKRKSRPQNGGINSPQTIHQKRSETSHEEISTGSADTSRRSEVCAEAWEKRGKPAVWGEPIKRKAVGKKVCWELAVATGALTPPRAPVSRENIDDPVSSDELRRTRAHRSIQTGAICEQYVGTRKWRLSRSWCCLSASAGWIMSRKCLAAIHFQSVCPTSEISDG